MKVWDAPTRLFHWAVVVLIACSYITRNWQDVSWHMLSGYTMLTLLLFRLAWGFVGSETSRFREFIRSPLEGLRHLAHFGRREPDDQVGHNAAGGWMVLVLLADLGVQVVTGLFAYDADDHVAIGPLAHLVSEDTAERISAIHGPNFYVILGLIVLHVLAVLAYAVVKKHNLLRPMITGRKRLPGATRQPRMASSFLALMLVVLSACIVWVLATRV